MRARITRIKGALSDLVLGMGVSLVIAFVVLFMLQKVSDITGINNTSRFYSTFNSLVSNTSTVFDVIILVIIIVALGVGINVLRGTFGAGGGAAAPSV
jgi:hypothetical protein